MNIFTQTNMMASTKEIARTAQNIVIQSTNEPDKLGGLATNISTQYQQLANDAKRASLGTSSAEMGQRIRVSVQELGQATIELVKATGSCQVDRRKFSTSTDSFGPLPSSPKQYLNWFFRLLHQTVMC